MGILVMVKFVSAYVERDKKILKLAVFGVQVATVLIVHSPHRIVVS